MKIPNLLVKNDYYLVPCVPIPEKLASLYLSYEDGWVPVLIPPHIDHETAFRTTEDGQVIPVETSFHFHVDMRFIKSDLPLGGSVGVSVKMIAMSFDLCDHDTPNDEIEDLVEDLVEWKLKKCYQLTIDDFENSVVPLMYEPAVIAEGLKLTDKGVCPHQKTCLRGVPAANGTIVCPAHGLKWNIQSGDLIPRRHRTITPYAMAMSELYRDVLKEIDDKYADNFRKENIKFEVWTRLPLPNFLYFDRATFETDRDRYL